MLPERPFRAGKNKTLRAAPPPFTAAAGGGGESGRRSHRPEAAEETDLNKPEKIKKIKFKSLRTLRLSKSTVAPRSNRRIAAGLSIGGI